MLAYLRSHFVFIRSMYCTHPEIQAAMDYLVNDKRLACVKQNTIMPRIWRVSCMR